MNPEFRTELLDRQSRTNVRSIIICVQLVVLALCAAAPAQSPADSFRQSCASCHTIGGGRLVGPDLKNVTQRKDRAWLTQFVQGPKAVIDSGDPYAVQLQKDAQGVVMPTLGLDAARVQALLALIEAESKLPKSQFAGTQISDRPFTSRDIETGRAIFTGTQALRNGGPACISCHTVRGLGGLSGGRLGPDLTLVYERLQGRKGLGAWMTNPASPTMTPTFKKTPLHGDDILPLLAYFESTAKNGGSDDTTARLNFLLIGMGATVIGLVVLDGVWKKRFRGVRRQLVNNSRGDK
ncbi:MAG TPA: cytochrome c [Terriglobales bacterium]|nr:cytochrome c [Terriglobales bacterium]